MRLFLPNCKHCMESTKWDFLVENCGEKKSFFFLTLFSSVVTKPRNPQNNGDTWENFINRKDKSRDLPHSSNWFFSTFLSLFFF